MAMRITIVGAGISGLSLAHALLQKYPEMDITIFESENRAGGKIWTDKIDGFLCEVGVNGFLDNKPNTLKLASSLGIARLKSNDNAKKRYIYSNSRLNQVPESPLAFLKSALLSPFGKLRIIGELFIPVRSDGDETLESFAIRRIGREAFEKLIDPMASGIYAGDPSKMSLKSCFPKIYELERSYGGLIKALLKLQKEAKKTGRKVGPGPGGVLTSFYDGMSTIINSLKNFLGSRLHTSSSVKGIEKRGNLYATYLDSGAAHESESVVIACPAYAAAQIVNDMDKEIADVLREIPYPPANVVCLGFRENKINTDLDGFGFLIPKRENRKILGTLYDSSIFPNRAPEGYALLRTIVGGARASDIALLDDERLLKTVLAELSEIMGIRAEPDFVRIYRHEKAIPQYIVGHQELLRQLNKAVSAYKGLFLTGNAYLGIGVNECIDNSFTLANRMLGYQL